MFTRSRHLSRARLIQTTPFQPDFLKAHSYITLPSTPTFSKWSLSLGFPHQKTLCASPFPHTCHLPNPSDYTKVLHGFPRSSRHMTAGYIHPSTPQQYPSDTSQNIAYQQWSEHLPLYGVSYWQQRKLRNTWIKNDRPLVTLLGIPSFRHLIKRDVW